MNIKIYVTAAYVALHLLCTTQADDPIQVRVLSYNIHHGEGIDGTLSLERIANVIRAASPDLVALQEVDRKTRRSDAVDQSAELARLTGMTAAFERNIDYQGGEYGNAILTRWRVTRQKNHALPSLDNGEQRGVLDLDIETTDGLSLRFLSTHLDSRLDDRERRASVEAIEKLLAVDELSIRPTILAGDLNALPDSPVLTAFRERWLVATGAAPTPTIPAAKPTRQIDYVLVRPASSWKVIEIHVIDEPIASDHRPILTVLEFVKK